MTDKKQEAPLRLGGRYVPNDDLPDIILHAIFGHEDCILVMHAVSAWAKKTAERPERCMCCRVTEHPPIIPEGYFVCTPSAEDHRKGDHYGIVLPICPTCKPKHTDQELVRIAMKTILETIPDSQAFELPSHGYTKH